MSVDEQSILKDIINAFLREPTEENMDALILSARKDIFSDGDILALASGLANSGETLRFKNTSFQVADIPSTGGPTSLSTLICPLLLVYFNKTVVKLGVPGRPAGGIDVLYQIKNYNIAPDQTLIEEWLQACGYVHFIANEKYAPLDAKLFAYRKLKNAIDLPSLVIASLLAKKIAAGLNIVGLDIRASKLGNFGKNWSESRSYGSRFNRIAGLAGIKSKCFLTNGDQPQQNYIGRGEALIALSKIFNDSADIILNKHYSQCLSMASSIGNEVNSNYPLGSDLKKIFFKNIVTQQGTLDSFFEKVDKIEKEHVHELCAEENGFLNINVYIIRDAIVDANSPQTNNPFPDTCGVILRKGFNEHVRKGDVICTYRVIESLRVKFHERIAKAFEVLPLLQNTNEFEEVL